MFEKFTEKAVNVIVEAQNIAIYDHSEKVWAEHMLLALVKETKGFCAKIFKNYDITYERLAQEIYMSINIEDADMTFSIPFSEDFKRILIEKRYKKVTELIVESEFLHISQIQIFLENRINNAFSTKLLYFCFFAVLTNKTMLLG